MLCIRPAGEGFDDAGWRGTCRSRRVAVHFSSSGDVDGFVARMVTIASLECRVEPASDPGKEPPGLSHCW